MREIKGKLNQVLTKKKSLIRRKLKLCIVFRFDINHLFSFKVNFSQGPLIVKNYSRRFLKF